MLPFFQKHRVALDLNSWQLKLIDQTNNEEYWKSQNLVQALYIYSQFPNVRHTYHTQGHLLFLNVGHMVYAFDAVDKKKLWEFNLYSPGTSGNAVQPSQNPPWQDKDGSLLILYQDGWMHRLGQPGPMEPSYICLQTRNGLVALDPVRGTVLWSKASVSGKANVFGDDQYVYVVELDARGNATGSQVLRAQDGVTVKGVPDFTAAYQNRLRTLGRNLLVRDNIQGNVVLRFYDVLTGKDLWKRTFPADSVVIRSDDPNLTGAIEPSGAVTVVDVHTDKVVLKTAVLREDVDKVQEAYLLLDSDHFYLAFNRQANPQVNPWGGPMSNLMYGMRALPVNGHRFYAFHRSSGKVDWWIEKVENQMLVMEQFKELPIIQFTSRYNRAINNNQPRFGNQPVVPFKSIDKRTGKLLMDEELQQNGNQFYGLTTNLRDGRIELVSFNLKIVHEPFQPGMKGQPSASASGSTTGEARLQELRARAEREAIMQEHQLKRQAEIQLQLQEKK